MDGPLMFRLILIVVAGFALVMIISNYNSSLAPSLESEPQIDEQFQADSPLIQPSYSSGKIREKMVVPTEDGTLTATASDTLSSAPTPLAVPGSIDSLKPDDLLPMIGNTPEEQKFISVNPSVAGDVGSQNFLQAGYWQGAITNVQKVANKQLRSDPLIVPQKVSPWMNTPFEMNAPNRPFEIGSVSSV